MMGFCLSSLTLGEIKLFLKKNKLPFPPAWVAIAWMNHCGVLSTETLHTIPCWIPGILGMGSCAFFWRKRSSFVTWRGHALPSSSSFMPSIA